MRANTSNDDNEGLEFYRISTESSVELDTQPLATRWIWYWQDQMMDWRKYGDVSSRGNRSTHFIVFRSGVFSFVMHVKFNYKDSYENIE